MKSAVATRPRPLPPSASRYTPASSEVSGPTSTRLRPPPAAGVTAPADGATSGAMSAKRSPGPIFAAQPPVVAHAVRRNFRRNNAMPRGFYGGIGIPPPKIRGVSDPVREGADARRTARPWWSLAAVPLFAIGLWTLIADVPGWNAVWYLFAWY